MRSMHNMHTLLGVGLRTVWIVCILLVVDIKKYPYHIRARTLLSTPIVSESNPSPNSPGILSLSESESRFKNN